MEKSRATLSKSLLIATVLLMAFCLFPRCWSENFTYTYQLLDNPNGSTYYKLNVTIQQSLYDYYTEKSHRSYSTDLFATFVTPYALKPIADNLWTLYTNDEDFVNGALMIVHQIPYEVTIPTKYPVETMVENKGDCDLLSYIAASIIKAGGLDVALLYYESQTHMNIGVSLSEVPHDARSQPFYVTYNGVQYYVAECTGGNWQTGWRVGECPDDLKRASVQVVTLENCEQTAPGQVSASYLTLESSTLSLNISPSYLIQGSLITFSGQLSPTLQNETVTIYAKMNNLQWIVLATVQTDSTGQFTYVWNAETASICYVRASWSGDNDYAGADSPTRTVTILSTFFVSLLAITALLACVGLIIFLTSRRTQPEIPEPQPPEIPS
jgi:hypothetical protein